MVADLCGIGDVTWAFQLALLMTAAWEQELDTQSETVIVCGDAAM